ncbi:hypothetical protein LTR37_017267 [Vermiconidia calcicola]|uniref:Uncharacterized protein n=1 Tax=Vermiconidia calcicola TaxID=1690605 RepID=A0ACC3MKJ3_9PEZI|nr:hypothetical protein LTR37_017267 [Vermiconidia calcicola]
MTTSFSSLPIVDLSVLSSSSPCASEIKRLSTQLYDVFATTGFAYLTNAPLSSSHEDVFQLASDFFRMTEASKMQLAKKTFVKGNNNTYRGYFPPQLGQKDNLKEGFEVGPSNTPVQTHSRSKQKFNLAESNVWPEEDAFPNGKARLEQLHTELQSLSSTLVSLLAISLGKQADFFSGYLSNSLSTLRLLHYPLQPSAVERGADEVKLCCTPHTDSGILTLLHQDTTGGLEVLNSSNEWIPAPYVPGSIVINIGDLLANVSGGRFVATMHRVRTNGGGSSSADGMGRFSVPFFFEPGEDCIVRSIDGGESVVYGEHVRRKMGTFVEFQDMPEESVNWGAATTIAVEA